MTLRLDRLASIGFATVLATFTAGRASRIPILMYHSIEEENESDVHPYYRLSTPPRVFADQMLYLYSRGYTTITPADVRSTLASGTADLQQQVAITFDDGFQNVYRHALPILQQYHFTATIFAPTAFIGKEPITFQKRECLTWAQIVELHRYGMEIGSHTVSHPQLHTLRPDQIRQEITRSKATIEEHISSSVGSFAYPYAFPQTDKQFTAMLQNLLKDAGYTNGVCTTVGCAGSQNHSFFMPRIPVNGDDDHALFRAKLEGAYDWVGWLQSGFKMLSYLDHRQHANG